MFGTCARHSSFIVVIFCASLTFSIVQAAVVSIFTGGVPFFSRPTDSAIEKQAASAAARSSSGFEPEPSSKREANEYGADRLPLAFLKLPLPAFSVPSHTALAFRVGILHLRIRMLRMLAQIGLGLAALGRPGYINLGHGQDLPSTDPAVMEAHCHQVLDAAYAAGVRYVDAARSYGRAEAFLASWLAKRKPKDLYVASKWGYAYTANWQVKADKH